MAASFNCEFLGVRLIQMGSRPRKAVKVLVSQYTMALLPNGSVAILLSKSDYEHPDRWSVWRQRTMAAQLHEIGAIDLRTYDDFMAKTQQAFLRAEARIAARDLDYSASTLGIKLTAAQKRQIARKTR